MLRNIVLPSLNRNYRTERPNRVLHQLWDGNMTHGAVLPVVKHLPEEMTVRQQRRFFAEVEGCFNIDRPCIVLDCSKMRQTDRLGIHVLLCCLEEAMKRNGDVKLAAIPPGIRALLEDTGAHRLFERFNTTAEALDSFCPPGAVEA